MQKVVFQKIKDTILKWKKVHPKKEIKTLFNIAVTNKKDKKDI